MKPELAAQLSEILAETQVYMDEDTGNGKYTTITEAQAMFLVKAGFDLSLLPPTTESMERRYLFPVRHYNKMSALLPDIFSLTAGKDERQ